MIEVFFRTLKSGCRVEARRFEEVKRFQTCLAIYMIVAWRTLFAWRLGRAFPDMNCEATFEPAEWKAAYRVVKRTAPPRKPSELKEMIRIVSQLGGSVNRSRPDEPGPQTVGLGKQRLHDLALCWNPFGPGAAADDVSTNEGFHPWLLTAARSASHRSLRMSPRISGVSPRSCALRLMSRINS